MAPNDPQVLISIADATYHRDLARVTGLMAQEARLRAQLRQLDDQEAKACVVLREQCDMQAIGADVIWRSWLSRTRGRLNLELAQVLSQKKPLEEAVRLSFGRKTALEELQKQQQRAQASKRARDAEMRALRF